MAPKAKKGTKLETKVAEPEGAEMRVHESSTVTDVTAGVGSSMCEVISSDAINPRHRTLKKKLGQIILLQEKQAKGEMLNEDQLSKIAQKEATEAEIVSILAGETPPMRPPTGKAMSLEEEVDSALNTPKEILDYVIALDREPEKRFRAIMKSFRELRKLQEKAKLEKTQQQKLDKLKEEVPLDLDYFRVLLSQLTDMHRSGQHDLHMLREERERQPKVLEPPGVLESPVMPSRDIAIGVDAGGVLTMTLNDKWGDNKWQNKKELEVPGAMRVLRRLAKKFGQQHVHIVSKCSGRMRKQTEIWLLKTMDITKIIPKENVHFCHERTGADGKGAWAGYLKLTHFIDDRPDCLWSVYNDEHGNAQEYIKRYSGKLYHFRQSGVPPSACEAYARGRCRFGDQCKYSHGTEETSCFPSWPKDLPKPGCVIPVDDWDHVERLLDDM